VKCHSSVEGHDTQVTYGTRLRDLIFQESDCLSTNMKDAKNRDRVKQEILSLEEVRRKQNLGFPAFLLVRFYSSVELEICKI
jgi:hypothetical protein